MNKKKTSYMEYLILGTLFFWVIVPHAVWAEVTKNNSIRKEKICKKPSIAQVRIKPEAMGKLLTDVLNQDEIKNDIQKEILSHAYEGMDLVKEYRECESSVRKALSVKTKSRGIKKQVRKKCGDNPENIKGNVRVRGIKIKDVKVNCDNKTGKCRSVVTANNLKVDGMIDYQQQCNQGVLRRYGIKYESEEKLDQQYRIESSFASKIARTKNKVSQFSEDISELSQIRRDIFNKMTVALSSIRSINDLESSKPKLSVQEIRALQKRRDSMEAYYRERLDKVDQKLYEKQKQWTSQKVTYNDQMRRIGLVPISGAVKKLYAKKKEAGMPYVNSVKSLEQKKKNLLNEKGKIMRGGFLSADIHGDFMTNLGDVKYKLIKKNVDEVSADYDSRILQLEKQISEKISQRKKVQEKIQKEIDDLMDGIETCKSLKKAKITSSLTHKKDFKLEFDMKYNKQGQFILSKPELKVDVANLDSSHSMESSNLSKIERGLLGWGLNTPIYDKGKTSKERKQKKMEAVSHEMALKIGASENKRWVNEYLNSRQRKEWEKLRAKNPDKAWFFREWSKGNRKNVDSRNLSFPEAGKEFERFRRLSKKSFQKLDLSTDKMRSYASDWLNKPSQFYNNNRLPKDVRDDFKRDAPGFLAEYEKLKDAETTHFESAVLDFGVPKIIDPIQNSIRKTTEEYVGGAESVLEFDPDEMSDNIFVEQYNEIFKDAENKLEQYTRGKLSASLFSDKGLNPFLKFLKKAASKPVITRLRSMMSQLDKKISLLKKKNKNSSILKELLKLKKQLEKELVGVGLREKEKRGQFYVGSTKFKNGTYETEIETCSKRFDEYKTAHDVQRTGNWGSSVNSCYEKNDMSMQMSIDDINNYLKMHFEKYSPYIFCGKKTKNSKTGVTKCEKKVQIEKPFQLQIKGGKLVFMVSGISKKGAGEFIKVKKEITFPNLIHESGYLQESSLTTSSNGNKVITAVGVGAAAFFPPALWGLIAGKIGLDSQIKKGAKRGLDLFNKNLDKYPVHLKEVHPNPDGHTITVYVDVKSKRSSSFKLRPESQIPDSMKANCYLKGAKNTEKLDNNKNKSNNSGDL